MYTPLYTHACTYGSTQTQSIFAYQHIIDDNFDPEAIAIATVIKAFSRLREAEFFSLNVVLGTPVSY